MDWDLITKETCNLQKYSYRCLQQKAKTLGLPSNVKKIVLIQLITAKKFRSAEDVDDIIKQVKIQRQKQSVIKKEKKDLNKTNLQGTEISSTSNHSPPITNTPKRSGQIVPISPEIVKFKPNSPILPTNTRIISKTQPNKTQKKCVESDRVLRSFNNKRPNYSYNNYYNVSVNEAIVGVYKAHNSVAKHQETKIKIVSQKQGSRKVNLTAVVKQKEKRSIENRICIKGRQQTQSAIRNVNLTHQTYTKRQRSLRGIYPFNQSIPNNNISTLIRHSDGRMTKINSYIKCSNSLYQPNQNPYLNCSENFIHKKTAKSHSDTSTQTDNYNYQNLNQTSINRASNRIAHMNQAFAFAGPPVLSNKNLFNVPTHRNYEAFKLYNDPYSMHHHKKIQAEQVKSRLQYTRVVENDWGLPNINHVFSKFNETRKDLMQPLYVQVSSEEERILSYPMYFAKSNINDTTMLENIYNFKNQFVVYQPLLKIATTSTTKCVYSTPIITTAMAQPSSAVTGDLNNSFPPGDVYELPRHTITDMPPRLYDYLRLGEYEMSLKKDFRGNQMPNASTSSLGSQNVDANVTIPEMVEDALELISQDGDYLERIEMDTDMQCILCSWAGPTFLLEYHVRKHHSQEMYTQESGEWNVTYTLGSLVRRPAWLSRVLQGRAALYALSAKYEDPDCFTATLTAISPLAEQSKRAKITIYNKVTGEPYSWEGEIDHISETMPYENQSDGLRLNLSNLNLLPNSANLQLLNRELVIKSPTKVVVGQPELNDIHIILFVKLIDC